MTETCDIARVKTVLDAAAINVRKDAIQRKRQKQAAFLKAANFLGFDGSSAL